MLIHSDYNNHDLQTLFNMSKNCLVFLICVFLLCGCQSTFGPRALKNTHLAYNQVIANTSYQQMLLNLVRLKYRDAVYFLQVGSVTASFSLGASLGLEAELDFDPGGDLMKPNAGMSYSQSPTISYTPLQGEDFLKSVLTPISLEAILVITQSGWSIERVFGICIERINNLTNAPRASGPTPDEPPKYKKFKRMLMLLRQLQLADLIEIGRGSNASSGNLVVLLKPDPNYQNVLNELRSLLGVTQQSNQFRISTNFLDTQEDQWNVRARSISSVLYYLSQNVEVPEKHKEAGLVTVTKTKDGEEFNWDETPAGTMFKVRSSKWLKPSNAFISVPYRGTWFYIADNDLQSKSTFKLLNALFSLQAGQIKDTSPTLTLPVGGK